jgi:hypothetical protein
MYTYISYVYAYIRYNDDRLIGNEREERKRMKPNNIYDMYIDKIIDLYLRRCIHNKYVNTSILT